MGKGHVLALDLLFPAGTTARADLEGLVALRKQVPELIAAQKQQPPPTREQLQELMAAAPPPNPLAVAGQLVGLAIDPTKQQALRIPTTHPLRTTSAPPAQHLFNPLRTLSAPSPHPLPRDPHPHTPAQALLEEAKNALRATPTGLEAPRYRVVRAWKGVELREYEPFTVARTDMSSVEGGGAGVRTLGPTLALATILDPKPHFHSEPEPGPNQASGPSP